MASALPGPWAGWPGFCWHCRCWFGGLVWIVSQEGPPGFLETFTYIFEKATFQRPPLLPNLNLLGRFISNLSLLIIPGQAALFLLALRNRLGEKAIVCFVIGRGYPARPDIFRGGGNEVLWSAIYWVS